MREKLPNRQKSAKMLCEMAKIRIISGEFGGRWIAADVGRTTHPMGDRVRSGLFAMLDSRDLVVDAEILDAFAGTGAVGFEAISRGAKFATFIERDRLAQKILTQNIADLQVEEKTKLIKTSVANWIAAQETSAEKPEFDLIFADPPYHDAQFSTVSRLTGYLKPNGLMVLSYWSRETTPEFNGVVVVDNRSYGEASLAFYKR